MVGLITSISPTKFRVWQCNYLNNIIFLKQQNFVAKIRCDKINMCIPHYWFHNPAFFEHFHRVQVPLYHKISIRNDLSVGQEFQNLILYEEYFL